MRTLILLGIDERREDEIINEIEKIDVLEISDETKKILNEGGAGAEYLIPSLAISQISLNIDKK